MRLRNVIVKICQTLGHKVYDVRDGALLGRAVFFFWKGSIYVVGAEGDWIPVPSPQKRMTYWMQSISFTRHGPETPERSVEASRLLQEGSCYATKNKVLLAVLDHREPELVESSLQGWIERGVNRDDLLLVYGGDPERYKLLQHKSRILIQGNRLRTKDHQREAQSYREILTEVTDWLESQPYTHVFFTEYDQRPLVDDPCGKYLERMRSLDADVLGVEVRRLDGTLNPHWLGTVVSTFPAFPVWSMLGTGHFWKREAWIAVARDTTYAEWYLELDLATTVVKNGFRLMDLGDQSRFVKVRPEYLPCATMEEARKMGAWTIHPVKSS